MTFSFTGINYLFSFILTSLLAYRFFRAWKKEKTILTRTFFYFGFALSLFFLMTTIGSLFFTKSSTGLKATVLATAFFQGLAAAFMAYLFFHIKFPNISGWYGFGAVFALGISAVILSAILPFNPHLEPTKFISWDVNPLAGLFRYLVFVIGLLPMCLVFLSRRFPDPSVRFRSFGLGLLLLITLLIVPFDFFLDYFLGLDEIGSDLALFVTNLALFSVLILTRKPSSSEKHIPPVSGPRIQW